MSNQKANLLKFETLYEDTKEPEFQVEYSSSGYTHDKEQGYIKITHLDDVEIPLSHFGWLLACLDRIKEEIGGPNE